jgi:hypothetical protein
VFPIAMGRGTINMSQLSRGILAAAAVVLTLGAAQFALGRDLSVGRQGPATAAEATTINRSAKADRAARVAAPALQTRTISLRLDALSATSVLIRIPLAQEARSGTSARSITKSPDRKLTVACEPVVSVLTEVARQLQPGRCVT